MISYPKNIKISNLKRSIALIDETLARLEIKLQLEANGLIPKPLDKQPSIFSQPSVIEKKIITAYFSEP
jgi:hypothetical protein